MAKYELKITTWRGICPGAIHWQGWLLNYGERFKLRSGSDCRFLTREGLIAAAKRYVKAHRGILILDGRRLKT